MPDQTLPLLNVYEVEIEGKVRHLIGFLDPIRAGALGIDRRAVLGEFVPRPDGTFDPGTFRLNPDFVATLTAYMNEAVANAPEVVRSAEGHPGGRVEILDPRPAPDTDPAAEPPAWQVLGHFAVDGAGRVVPGSFAYNPGHAWFGPESGLLSSRKFYDWIHP